jgi:hypothetical protein
VLATGLDFSYSDSLFYVDSECPIFVDECFNPDLSSSFTYSEYAFEEITAGGVRKGTKATAAFGISDIYFVDFEFGLVTHTEPRSLEFREVAGMIGANKLSTVFRDSQIIVAEDPDLGTPNIAYLEKELELADTDFFVIIVGFRRRNIFCALRRPGCRSLIFSERLLFIRESMI